MCLQNNYCFGVSFSTYLAIHATSWCYLCNDYNITAVGYYVFLSKARYCEKIFYWNKAMIFLCNTEHLNLNFNILNISINLEKVHHVHVKVLFWTAKKIVKKTLTPQHMEAIFFATWSLHQTAKIWLTAVNNQARSPRHKRHLLVIAIYY